MSQHWSRSLRAWAARKLLGVDAVASKPTRRKAASSLVKGGDDELVGADRDKLVSVARELQLNYAVAAWAMRKHLDYVSTFRFKAKSGNDALDADLEGFVAWWGRPENFAADRRHGLARSARMWEARSVIDGDVLALKLSTGRLQTIEGDRIRNPYGVVNRGINASEYTQGVRLGPAGEALGYAIHKRSGAGGGFSYERTLDARWCLLHAQWDTTCRFDQVRGISPLVTAINNHRDTYDALDLALAKARVQQLFALAIYSDSSDETGVSEQATDADGNATERYTVDFGGGPVKLELRGADRAEFLQSHEPSGEFKDFTQLEIAIGLKSLDIPFSFFSEDFTNWVGQRQANLQYESSADIKRGNLRDVLDNITRWRMAVAIAQGVLTLPKGYSLGDPLWSWIPAGVPWYIDPLKEVAADREAVGGGFSSTVGICKARGLDAYEIADEEAAYQDYRASKGLARSDAAPAAPEKPNRKGEDDDANDDEQD